MHPSKKGTHLNVTVPVFSGIRLQITDIFMISNLHACKIHACAFQRIRIHADGLIQDGAIYLQVQVTTVPLGPFQGACGRG